MHIVRRGLIIRWILRSYGSNTGRHDAGKIGYETVKKQLRRQKGPLWR
jgi:hypothetical protein